ncbi:hypothetical protein ACFOON_10535 [Novosphingobium piscinae]|uniref:Uncharacterized protein n=1 Tax=Novosphingobium piscinae TaxID=1507448 RepID=A0A7X1FZS0_9SPHN|nr:hypothetical protein [Novosphingobium piscinae]MBC2669995.1 hypothetical protein [Novosphingobium piscinae]
MTSAAKRAADPFWFPWRFDEAADGFQLRHLTRQDHARATFLTEEYLGSAPVEFVPRANVPAVAQAPLHFIFHSAFCLSSVLVRAFDLPGAAMGLKEPMVLNDLAGWHLRGTVGPQLAQAMDASLALLARPLSPGEAVVVKPSNIANALIAGMLQLRPQARALLLHAPLPVYLGSIARKGLEGRLWVRDLLVKQLGQGLHEFGFTAQDYLGQSDLQVAAMGWLAQQRLFGLLAGRFGERVRTLNSDLVTARPAEVMSALATLFGVPLDVPAVLAGPAFTRHSKHGTAFDAAAREREREAEAAHADEIGKVTYWAERVAESQGIALTLPNPLIR